VPPNAPALFHSLCDYRSGACKILDQILRHAVTLLQVLRTVVGDKYLALAIFGNQRLERKIDRQTGRRTINGVPPLGLPKIRTLVGRIFNPTFPASPL
jgi:hypothetical protein